MDIKEITKLSETAYFSNTSEKIEQLSGEDRGKFNEALEAILTGETWFVQRGLDPFNYDEKRVKIILYNEMFENDFSYLHRD